MKSHLFSVHIAFAPGSPLVNFVTFVTVVTEGDRIGP
jgi:hypothetical protein